MWGGKGKGEDHQGKEITTSPWLLNSSDATTGSSNPLSKEEHSRVVKYSSFGDEQTESKF